jgi:hypothetical protein
MSVERLAPVRSKRYNDPCVKYYCQETEREREREVRQKLPSIDITEHVTQ